MKSKWMLLMAAMAGLSLNALSEEGADKPKDKKPKMTAEEKFAKLDTNGDGVLSFEEWSAKPEKKEKQDKPKKQDKGDEPGEEMIDMGGDF